MCRSGCPTKDHSSWGECLRAARIQIGDIRGRMTNKAWDYELDQYEAAVRQGVEPKGTRLHQVREALDFADKTGVGNPWT